MDAFGVIGRLDRKADEARRSAQRARDDGDRDSMLKGYARANAFEEAAQAVREAR